MRDKYLLYKLKNRLAIFILCPICVKTYGWVNNNMNLIKSTSGVKCIMGVKFYHIN